MKNFFKTLVCIFTIMLMGNSTLFSQSKLFGRITDQGEPLIGATIIISGTTIGTSSDIDGNYNLSLIHI